MLNRYVGTYQIAPQFSLTISVDGDQLMTQATGQPKVPVYPESRTKFFLKVVDAELEFTFSSTGQVTGLVLHQNGHDIKGVKK